MTAASHPPRFNTALVVDDHPIVADAVSSALLDAGLAERVEIAHDCDTVMEAAGRQVIGLALVDLGLSGASGAEVLHRLRDTQPYALLILMTGAALTSSERAHVSAEADGFYHKSDPVERLLELMRGAGSRPGRLPRSSPRNGVAGLTQLDTLTPRERTIPATLGAGRTLKSIAGELGISADTVRKHREHLRAKLGVDSSLKLVSIAVQAGLV